MTGYLNLYNNRLTGVLPPNLNLRELSFLDLGRNDFSGNLPNDWWEQQGGQRFNSLRHLHLDHNRFSGSLPEEFPQIGLGRLNQLTLANNDFTGVVPGDWDPIDHLVTIDIRNNSFSEFGKDLCKMSVFSSGELATLRADCSICNCGAPFCVEGVCSAP